MKRPFKNQALFFLLLLAVLLPFGLRAAETGERAAFTAQAAPAADAAVPSPAPAEATPQPAAGQPDEEEAFQALKHRYRQDPTGVRARLGLCRRGQGERGGGHHHHRHGAEQ